VATKNQPSSSSIRSISLTFLHAGRIPLSFTGGLIPAALLSASASLARKPKQIGTLQGLFNQVGNIGPFFAPPLIAMLVAASGLWRDALIVTACAALLDVILGVVIRWLER